MNALILSKTTMHDADLLFHWRNDLITRESSFNSEPIIYQDHINWLKNSLNNPNHLSYIGQLNQQKIGVCRFNKTHEHRTILVSINLNPNMRKQALSLPFLYYSIQTANHYFNIEHYEFIAQIKKENIASIKIFARARFNYFNEETHHIILKYQP